MKFLIVLLSLLSFSYAVPEPRQFHDHFDEFIDVIMKEAGDKLDLILRERYLGHEEFTKTLEYLSTNSFSDLVVEMEHLPEFIAVVTFLENNNIDITYFIESFNEMLEDIHVDHKRAGSVVSGRDFNSFIKDVTAAFPQQSLAALFDHKMAKDKDFNTAITNLQSNEWDQVFGAFWNSKAFQREKHIVADNGLDLDLVLTEIMAVFGQ